MIEGWLALFLFLGSVLYTIFAIGYVANYFLDSIFDEEEWFSQFSKES